jgi:hypothetical protein
MGGVVAFAGSPWFQVSKLLMVVGGFANICSHALVQTVIQTYSPSEFRGRTMSVFHMSNVVLNLGKYADWRPGDSRRNSRRSRADGNCRGLGHARDVPSIAARAANSLTSIL